MLGKVKKRGLAAAALAVIAMGASAHAVVVGYYTTGAFSSASATTVLGQGGSTTETFGTSTITFSDQVAVTPATEINVAGGGWYSADMGTFSVTNSGTTTNAVSDGFTLSVYQVLPSVGGQATTLLAKISGNITVTGGVGGTSDLTFSANQSGAGLASYLGIPTVVFPYLPNDPVAFAVYQNTPVAASGQTTTLHGAVEAVPLPSTASAGLVALAGLGAFGGVKKLRERNAASLAL